MKKNILSALVGFSLCPALALASPPEDMVTLEVLPGWQTDRGTQMAAIRLTLAPGWKTYWRAPGDAGIPPLFTWGGSTNIAAAEFHWPVPEVFDQNGMRSIGYTDQVVIPIELTPTRPGAAIRMAGELDIGVCHEICVPARLAFSAELLPGGGRDPAIVAALVDRPMTAAEAGVSGHSCRVSPGENGLSIDAEVTLPQVGPNETVVIEAGDPSIWVSEPEVLRHGGTLTATAEMIPGRGQAFALDRSDIRITVLGGNRAVDIVGCPAG